MVLELIAPTSSLSRAWRDACREWGPGQHEDGFGLVPEDDVATAEGFARWLERLAGQSEHCTYRWIVERGEVLGGIALRLEFTELVSTLGHIGYGVRPGARGRGVATWALGKMLDEARERGLARVLIICDADNVASATVIERHNGILDDALVEGDPMRYWISFT